MRSVRVRASAKAPAQQRALRRAGRAGGARPELRRPSRRRSRSGPHRRRQATCRSSARSPASSSASRTAPPCRGFNPLPDLINHAAQIENAPCRPSSPIFSTCLPSRGFIHQVSEPEALDALARAATDHRLYRLRLHRAVAACRHPAADHDAVLAAADRPPADRADGRRHHAGRRSVRQGRKPAAADRRR